MKFDKNYLVGGVFKMHLCCNAQGFLIKSSKTMRYDLFSAGENFGLKIAKHFFRYDRVLNSFPDGGYQQNLYRFQGENQTALHQAVAILSD